MTYIDFGKINFEDGCRYKLIASYLNPGKVNTVDDLCYGKEIDSNYDCHYVKVNGDFTNPNTFGKPLNKYPATNNLMADEWCVNKKKIK